MKYLLAFVLCSLSFITFAHESEFDSELAEKLQADAYGMKQYVLVVLLTGGNTDISEEEKKKAFAGHFSNMKALAEQQKLVVAGPFIESAPKRGLFIFNTDSIEEAQQWVNTDPAVKAGIFTYELNKIYSSAALMLVNDHHATLAEKNMD
ncbi:YciI family protein [Glaciecola sp. 1036]|uniref:YciI family protein n=1 Tax=Alteromonadaceae TaxID=72275 RepID=UPI003D091214